MNTAEELAAAWNAASKESGFHDSKPMTRVHAEKSKERFYDLFFRKTGIHPSRVVGLFIDWKKLSYEDAKDIHLRHGGENSFCAYIAEMLHLEHVTRTTNSVMTEDGLRSFDESH